MNVRVSQGAHLKWSTDLAITSATGACEPMFRASPEMLLGRSLTSVLKISEARACSLDAKARGEGGTEFVLMDPDAPMGLGAIEPVHTYLRLDLTRDAGLASAFVLDLTALLRGAPPLQISKLSSSLSHEIRNPLSSVKMAVQTLARNPGHSDRDKRRLTIAQREIRTMERMLWMLSEYGRDTRPHLEPLTLRSLLTQATEMIEPELAERQASLEIHEEGEPGRVLADAARIRPVLAQLLLNVAVGLEPGAQVSVRLRPEARGASLRIQDPTSELLLEERDTLFEPFGSRLARGAGLSLAALRQVMLRQGGQIVAEGGEKSGTVFILTFPPAP